MLYAHSSVEAELLDAVRPRLEKLGVHILSADVRSESHVIDLTLQLPAWSDRDLRHDVIYAISELEQQLDYAVTTNPTFVWGEPESNE